MFETFKLLCIVPDFYMQQIYEMTYFPLFEAYSASSNMAQAWEAPFNLEETHWKRKIKQLHTQTTFLSFANIILWERWREETDTVSSSDCFASAIDTIVQILKYILFFNHNFLPPCKLFHFLFISSNFLLSNWKIQCPLSHL